MYRIISVEPSSDYNIRLHYADRASFEVDIRPLIDTGGAFAPLADRALFEQVRIGEGGRYVEWPGDVDLCADALWLEGQKQGQDQRSSAAG